MQSVYFSDLLASILKPDSICSVFSVNFSGRIDRSNRKMIKAAVLFLVIFSLQNSHAIPVNRSQQKLVMADDGRIYFVDDIKSNENDNVITPPVLPVLDHLENDPTTLTRQESDDLKIRKAKESGLTGVVGPRLGFSNGFGLGRTEDGGFSASFSQGFSGLAGANQAGSHSVTVGGVSKGFQVSQASSQSSSFGGTQSILGSSFGGSQSSSQSSSFSAGHQGISSVISSGSAAQNGGSILGQGFSNSNAQSQSAAGSFGAQGISSAFGQGSGSAASYPGQTFANGQSSSGSFGNGAVGQATGGGAAHNSNGFTGTAANSQSLAAVNTGSRVTGGSNAQNVFGGQSNFAPQQNFQSPASTGRGNTRPIVFPGQSTNRQRNLQYQTIQTQAAPQSAVRWQRQPKRRPSEYQWIRIEV